TQLADKTGQICSVENLSRSNDHYVMCDNPEDDLTTLAPVSPRPQRRAEPALDHRVDRLRLPPLAVLGLELGEPLLHPPAPLPDRWLLRRPAPLRGDDRADPVRPPDPLVDPLGVVVGVRQQGADPRPAGRVPQRRPELPQVRPGA